MLIDNFFIFLFNLGMIDLILLRGLVLVLNLFFIYLGVFFIFYLWVVITLQIIKISACVATTPLLLLIKFVFFLINSVQVLLLILSALIPNSQNLTHYHLFNLSFSLFILHRFFFLLTFALSRLIPHILNFWVRALYITVLVFFLNLFNVFGLIFLLQELLKLTVSFLV